MEQLQFEELKEIARHTNDYLSNIDNNTKDLADAADDIAGDMSKIADALEKIAELLEKYIEEHP
jgi:methyl-accepting chemotaxis protein